MAEKMNNLTGKEWLQNSFSIWRDIRKSKEERELKHPAMFPEQLASKLIEIYTKDKGELVLDPFAGVGSTLFAARRLGRKSIGTEVSDEYISKFKQRLKNIQIEFGDENKTIYNPEIHKADARSLTDFVMPETVDISISSPPYWDILNQKRSADKKEIRNYGNGQKDLGNIKDYHEFLNELKAVYSKVYEVLKPNKRCCVVAMDIRKKDKFYPFHIDLTNVMTQIGFELEEFVIWDRQHEYNNMKTLGYPWVFRFNKVHEFICIYWKR